MTFTEFSIPSHVPPELVRDFDYFKPPGSDRDPHGAIMSLFDEPPLFYTPSMGGYWVVTRARLIDEVLSRVDIFSNSPVVLKAIATDHYPMVPEELDPPEHIKYRRLLSPIFARQRMQGLSQFFAEITHELIDAVIDKGRCDFIRDIAGPLPFRVFLHMMALPEDYLPTMLGWVNGMMHSADPGVISSNRNATEAFFRQLARERRKNPGTDMLSQLLVAEVDGKPIREEPLISMTMVLMLGSLDTTTAELGFMARFLADNPRHRHQLVAEPELVANAVEEMMRHFGVINSIRTIKQDVTLAGVQLKNGEQLLVPHMLWGLDPEQVDNPYQMDFKRDYPPHHLFGSGLHSCAGAPLVRVEIPVFWTEWLKRIPDFNIADRHAIRGHVGMMMGLDCLPLAWTPN